MADLSSSPTANRVDSRGAFQTADRVLCGSGISINSGRRYLGYFTAVSGDSFSNLDIVTGAGAVVSVTAARLGLYTVAANGDLTLVCQTANDATIGVAANTEYARALDATGGYPTTYTLARGARYAAAFYITAGTPPTIFGLSTNSVLNTLSPRAVGFDNSGVGTDLNTSLTAAQISNVASLFYVAGI